MRQRKMPGRFAALVCAAALGLSGCDSAQEALNSFVDQDPEIVPGTTISADSKWINSDIIGAIDENTAVREQDDFYTAVNRDAILSVDPSKIKDGEPTGTLYESTSVQYERLLTLLDRSVDDTTGLDEAVMSAEELRHLQTLVRTFYDRAADLPTRNEQGAEPLRPYLEKIKAISSLDELTAYLADVGGANVSGISLLPISISRPQSAEEEERYTVLVEAKAPLTLGDTASRYKELTISSKDLSEDLVFYALGQLGYEKAQIRRILNSCYRFEIKLAKHMPTVSESDGKTDRDEINIEEQYQTYDLESLKELAGNYPMETLLLAAGLDASETYMVEEPDQVKNVGSLYIEENLSDIQNYLIVQLVRKNAELLDETLHEKAQSLKNKEDQISLSGENGAEAGEGSADENDEVTVGSAKTDESKATAVGAEAETGTESAEDEENSQSKVIISTYISPYMRDAFEEIYIGHYCDAKTKEELTELTEQMAEGFRQVLLQADWMSEETREKALDKLDHMGLHVLYPDKMTDFSTLSFEGCDSLIEIVGRLKAFRQQQMKAYVNQPLDTQNWDLRTMPTSIPNAAYDVLSNSVNICAGFLCTKDVYDTEAGTEYNFGRMGTIIGHEISHGFDTTGYSFDRNGLREDWWTAEDREAFDIRSQNLIKYYNALSPLPNEAGSCDGKRLSGEAIADMGGVKAALLAAAEIPDFDYEEFFRNYAKLWFMQQDYHAEYLTLEQDEHPLAFLRVNVTLQQFEKFLEIFHIVPGDGMYPEDENRIAVW